MDERLRRLERAAAAGDPGARAELRSARDRLRNLVHPARELPYVGVSFRMGLELPGPPHWPGSDERVDAVETRALPAHRRWWIGVWEERARDLAPFAGAGLQGIALSHPSEAALAEIRRLAEAGEPLTHLHLTENDTLSDAALAELSAIDSLQGLRIAEPAPLLTAAALDELARCTSLRELDLGSIAALQGGATGWLEPLQQLESLRLSGEFQLRYDLDPLRRLPALRSLELHIVDEPAAPALADLGQLESLCVTYTIMDEAFGSLARLEGLRRLDISGVGVSPEQIALVGALSLEHLGLYAVDLWGDELSQLPPGLSSLELRELMNLDALEPLAELTALESLTVHSSGEVTAALPKQLAACPSLRWLYLTSYDGSPASFLPGLVAALPNLEALILERPQATDDDFQALEGLEQLTHLRLYQAPNLKSASFARRLPALTHLHLASCEGLDASAVETLAELKGLRWLSLSDCYGLPHDAHGQLAQALPECVVCY